MFVQGYFATITVNGTTLEVYSSDAGLTLINETLDKTTLGVANRQKIKGLQDGNINVQMHLDTVGVVGVQAAYAGVDPVAFVFRPGKLGGPDAGQWSGSMIVTDLEIPGSVDDNWQMNIRGEITGVVTFTAPA